MKHSVHLVVTCTDRKTRDVPEAMQLRSVRWGSIERRCEEWIDRVKQATGATCSAQELYAGDHWTVARKLPEVARTAHLDAIPWIASAGYGLVRFDAPVHPYAATFAAGQPDSVCRPGDGRFPDARSMWWHWLGRWEGHEPGSPRTVSALIESHPDTTLIIAASPSYLDAMRHDLRRVLSQMDPDRIAIFCAGHTAVKGLDQILVPCDSRLRQINGVGGSMQSLNVRLTRLALQNWPRWEFRTSKLREWFHDLLALKERSPAVNRDEMSDEQVRTFIRAELDRDPKLRHSPLLHRLRDSGRACEQSRFARLFREAKETISGNEGR